VGRRGLHLGPLACLSEGRRHARARCGSERQHHHPRAGARGVRIDARARRVRSRRNQGAGCGGMTALLLLLLSAPCIYWTQGTDSRAKLEAAGIKRLCVAPEQIESWQAAGFLATALTDADLAA